MRRFLVVLHTTALIIACLSVPIAIFIALRIVPLPLVQVPNVTNADLMATLLTGLTLVLGLVAIVIAGLAIWGYHAIRDEAARIANEQAQTEARLYLQTPAIQELIRTEAIRIASEEAAKVRESLEFSIAYFQTLQEASKIPAGEKTEKVGRPLEGRKPNDQPAGDQPDDHGPTS